MSEAICPVCPHHCRLKEGAYGRCRARKNVEGSVVPINYGKLTALALDPIEKKPIAFFHPGSYVLSVGSFGCNLSCPFCQNYEIAAAGEETAGRMIELAPWQLRDLAKEEIPRGNIGVAYTYNEALVGYEYVRDAAKLVHEAGLLNVLVTNGMAELPILEEFLPYMDAMNIDLKGFRPEIYKYLGGDFETVKRFIARSAKECHVELTTLIVPGMNDDFEDMRREAEWIAEIDSDIPLHITRYFPRHKMKKPPTDIKVMRRLKAVAEESLSRVLLGNV
ncbi:MAG: radical SAM protein [Lachnospiraceae bacterium]|nr:radical SAM protein [Lachnospiraceae bacterium]